jgi:hypothetical protein
MKILLITFSFLCGINQWAFSQNFITVKNSKLRIKELYTGKKSNLKTKYPEFEISDLITVSEYNVFLEALFKDSGEIIYNKYLPQPNLNEKAVIDAFWSNTNFDNEPAIGVSWESALAYCKWSEKMQGSESNYSYRLPNVYEWTIFASQFMDLNLKNFGFFSEWTINAMDEFLNENYSKSKKAPLKIFEYNHSENNHPMLKRKIVLGNNFMEKFKFPIDAAVRSYYANEGYRTIGFRMVRTQTQEN